MVEWAFICSLACKSLVIWSLKIAPVSKAIIMFSQFLSSRLHFKVSASSRRKWSNRGILWVWHELNFCHLVHGLSFHLLFFILKQFHSYSFSQAEIFELIWLLFSVGASLGFPNTFENFVDFLLIYLKLLLLVLISVITRHRHRRYVHLWSWLYLLK